MIEPITTDEWLAELERIESETGEGTTVFELTEALGHSSEWVRRKLRIAINANKIAVTRRRVTDIAGRPQWVPAYKIKANQCSTG